MKKLVLAAAVTFALAACGSTDDADAPAEADTVEMPADEVMVQPGMDEDPTIDESLADETVTPTDEETVAPADAAADDAADAAADLEAAMAE
ncbi:hypothetical protein [Croceicoccus naphthovorans]|uniref:Uncharacterized protein n=1 Tax=Croceicoccus naphthovorans TaxID=1348774 RepID=A0A0G3XKX5_9SPHN|nr:hypothetical protein [Croceicoccus naphthovorans]AKM11251.1 hypothetical protein AB433_16745 [Croceicoccus naphthovorans]MBB3989843.1 type IV pilus biogenesis protein CpaD/CtpE [Croceicoccus naphthovorans]